MHSWVQVHCRCPLQTSSIELENVIEFVHQLPPWECELLQMIEVSADIFGVGVAISHGLCAVSDGSVWNETNGAFGWVLSTDQGERVAKGMGPARGVKHHSRWSLC